jgi:methionine salvage enolase-phosphatase E1
MPTITQEIAYRVKVKAVMEEEDLSLSVSVSFPYADRMVTDTVDEFDQALREKVAAVLSEVRQTAEKTALAKAQRAAYIAEHIATSRKEM